ncbi:MAG: PAS domain-containing protein, partial [Chloroflexota bacterium]
MHDSNQKSSERSEDEIAALKAEMARLREENAKLTAQLSVHTGKYDQKGATSSSSQRPELALMVVNLLDEFLFYKSKEGVYLFVNDAFAKNYGLTPNELIGKTDAELIGRELANKFGEDDKIVYQTGKTLRKETVVRHSVGYYDLIQTIKFPVFDHNREVTGIVGTARDISEFKQREKKLSNNLDDIASHAQQLNLLYRLAERMSRSKAIHEAYQLIAQNTPLITRSDGCSITLLR